MKNDTTQRKIKVSVGGTQHFSNFTGDPLKWSLSPKIEILLKRAVPIRTEVPDARRSTDKNIRAFHKFALPVTFNGDTWLARLTVREDGNGDWFYDGNLLEIEKPADGSTGPTDLTAFRTPDIQRASEKIAREAFSVNPESVSKVVDENGEPLVVYHGSRFPQSFEVFEKQYDYSSGAFMFTPDREYNFIRNNPNVRSFFLSIRNPADVPFEWAEGVAYQPDSVAEDRAKGHDGLIYRGDLRYPVSESRRFTQIAAYSPTQIKSATGNTGAFDPANPDIRYSSPSDVAWDARLLEDGTIELNAAHIDAEDVPFKIEHEIGHQLHNDPKMRPYFDRLLDALSPDQRKKIEGIVSRLYSDSQATEETRVRALEEIRRMASQSTPDSALARAWKTFVQYVRLAWSRLTGQMPKHPEALAARMVEIGLQRRNDPLGRITHKNDQEVLYSRSNAGLPSDAAADSSAAMPDADRAGQTAPPASTETSREAVDNALADEYRNISDEILGTIPREQADRARAFQDAAKAIERTGGPQAGDATSGIRQAESLLAFAPQG